MKKGWRVLLLALAVAALGCGTAGERRAAVYDGGVKRTDADTGAAHGECADEERTAQPGVADEREGAGMQWRDMKPSGALSLSYATQFAADFYEGGYALLTIGDDERFLVVPEGGGVPAGLDADIAVLRQPIDRIYLVATSAMDFFRALEGIDRIRLSGTDADGWYIGEAKEALAQGEMLYAGKYSAPDYELIVGEGCNLAVESTMILHAPEVKEQLERLGIPVLVERSSYESHPLGRMEWIKLYGALLGKEAEATDYFDGLMERLSPILEQENTGKTVAFFYITSAGAVNVRRSGDYIARSIDLAGGVYIFPDLESGDNAQSTLNMQMESFYDGARNADILVYNSAIDGELTTVNQLLEKSAVLADFKAVQEGNVWCAGKNLFQESLGLGDLILDLHTVLTGGEGGLTYLHHLE